MVLVDNEQLVLDRLNIVKRLHAIANLVVLHDFDVVDRRPGTWRRLRRYYKYCFVFRRWPPYTAIFSNVVDPRSWFSSQ